MHISDLKIGQKKTIVRILNPQIESKLACMGVRAGATVELLRTTNFAKTFYLKINANRMAIRASEAASIELS